VVFFILKHTQIFGSSFFSPEGFFSHKENEAPEVTRRENLCEPLNLYFLVESCFLFSGKKVFSHKENEAPEVTRRENLWEPLNLRFLVESCFLFSAKKVFSHKENEA
jgi:hypothetical protein